MFSKDTIGLRVTCEKYGEGIISAMECSGNLAVKFPKCNIPNNEWYYNTSGRMVGSEDANELAICLLDNILVTEEWSNPVEYTVDDIIEHKTDIYKDIAKEYNEKYAPPSIERALPNVIIEDKVVALSPELLAEYFWKLDSSEQARFYNHLDTVADFQFPFQLQSITDEDGLTLAGRRVMGCIGEYSHWGLVPKLKYDGSIK